MNTTISNVNYAYANNQSGKKIDKDAILFPTYSLIKNHKYKTEALFTIADLGLMATFARCWNKNKISKMIDSIIAKKGINTSKVGMIASSIALLGSSILHSFVANKIAVNKQEEQE